MIRLRAPGKLNLLLRVLGRRDDGYHEIETVLERVDLADELTFETHPQQIVLTCSDPTLSCGEDNLILKAARLLQRVSGTTTGARIHLTKRVPIAAGMGGGSSDAAATLVGLNQLWELGLAQTQLVESAAQLGSDVPFFLSPMPFAIARGRGERCEPLPAGVSLAHVVVSLPQRLSTREIYEGAQFDLTARHGSSTIIEHALRNGSLGELAEGLWNDLEPEAIRRCPRSALIQGYLRTAGCLAARVTGSGPTVFGLCRDLLHAREASLQLSALLQADPSFRSGGVSSLYRIEVVQTDGTLLSESS